MIQYKDASEAVLEIPTEVLAVLSDDNYKLISALEISETDKKPVFSTEQFYHGARVHVLKGAYSRPEFLIYFPKGHKEPTLAYRIMPMAQYREQQSRH